MHIEDSLETVVRHLLDSSFPVLPVVDAEDRLQGVVNLEEVHLASQAVELRASVLATDLMRTDITPLTLEDGLDRALELFVENDLLALPIVDDPSARRVIGLVRRADVANAYLREVHGGYEDGAKGGQNSLPNSLHRRETN